MGLTAALPDALTESFDVPDDLPARSTGASCIVFHSPHAGHRPIHLELSLPHEVQYQTVFDFPAILSIHFPWEPEQLHVFYLPLLYLEPQCGAFKMPTLKSRSAGINIQQVIFLVVHHLEYV